MNKNTIWVLIGLAIGAVAVVAGLTRDRWSGGAPQTVAGADSTKTAETATPAPSTGESSAGQQPAAQTEQQTAASTGQQPAAQAPAVPETQQQTAAAQPEQTAAPSQPEQPAAPAQPQSEQPASTAAAQPEQPAAQPEQPAAQPEQPAAQPEQPAAQPEQPAAAAQPQQQPPAAPAAPEKVPAFDTVRVEKTGEAVIAGTAEAGSEVTVKLDGQAIGKTTANTDGAFVVIPEQPLPPGSGALTIESKGKGDLEATSSEQSVAVIVPAGAKQDALVAVVSPNAPTKVLQKPEPAPAPAAETQTAAGTQTAAAQPQADSAPAEPPAQPEPAAKPAKLVSIDAVDYDSAGNIVFSGQGSDGHTARVYIDNGFVGEAAVGSDGRWTFSATANVAQGVHQLRVDGIDPGGKVVNRVEVPFFREDQSKVAAAAPQPEAQPAQSAAPAQPASGEAVDQQPAAPAAPAATPPAATPPATTQPAVQLPKDGRVVIQPGNNLWRISRVLYGSGGKYTVLYEANKDQIRDPDLIYPGQIFKTPDVAAKIESIDPKRRDPLKPEENAATGQ